MSDDQARPVAAERVLYKGHLHWSIFVRPVMVTCLALTAFKYDGPLLGAALVIVAALFWSVAALTAAHSSFMLTDRRVRVRSGYVWRVSFDLPLDQVDSVAVRQDMMGRLLGYGTLVLDGDDGSRAVCPSVSRAGEFREQVKSRMAQPAA